MVNPKCSDRPQVIEQYLPHRHLVDAARNRYVGQHPLIGTTKAVTTSFWDFYLALGYKYSKSINLNFF
jgi:hypothetical protein